MNIDAFSLVQWARHSTDLVQPRLQITPSLQKKIKNSELGVTIGGRGGLATGYI